MSNRNVASQSISPASLPDGPETTTAPERILRLPEVIARVGLRRASIYQHIAIDAFPKQVPLGARAVGWYESEIDAWVFARKSARRNPAASPHPV